jgi:predicted RNA-binding protein YlxR (DUF448 family)
MCVSCRESSAKRTLTRIVRTPEGTVEIDPTGKRNGRGAYLCDRPTCWTRALKTRALDRALNLQLPTQTVEELQRHAAKLAPATELAVAATTEEGVHP